MTRTFRKGLKCRQFNHCYTDDVSLNDNNTYEWLMNTTSIVFNSSNGYVIGIKMITK